ncbi:phosphotransferase family protein [Saccharopolyspora tripterygii]
MTTQAKPHTADHPVERNLARRFDEKLRRRSGGVHREPQSLAQTRERLERFLSARVDGPFEVEDFSRLSGGGANESYSFRLVRAGQDDELVLRVKAPVGICITEVEREFQLLRATHGVIPVPEPHWVTTDPDDFGEPALIAGKVPGVPSPTQNVPHATGLGTAYGPDLRRLLAPQFVEHLARLHAHDWSDDHLSGFDLPRRNTTDAIDWRLAMWNRAWDEDALEPHPTVLLARQWLAENRPVVDHVSLLHGDYRNGNFLFEETSGEITAILDWELGYLGDRHSDLAYAMLPGWGHPDEGGHYLNSGLVHTDAFIADYERISGLPVDRERLDYYLVLNLYWAVVSLIGTGPCTAAARMTELDVMYNFISGLGGYFIGELNRILAKG